MKLQSIVSAAVVLTLTAAVAGQNKLTVGSQAPGLDISTWVKGSQTTIEEGNVYIIEFWATWCGPCRASIPHLTEIQKQYRDDGLILIGISTDQDTDKVAPFVKAQGNKMDYTVAIDRNRGTSRAWMDAAGMKGIPCAFIVDRKGKIAWMGNPHPQASDGFDETIRQVMSGRFDPKLQREAEPVLQAARSARKVRNWLLASKHYDEVISKDPAIFAGIALEKFEMFLVDMDDRDRAYDYAKQTLAGNLFANDAGALQMLAEKIATDPRIDQPKRDMELALEVAEASKRIAPDAKALAVLAMVRYHRGELDEAVELQRQAFFNANPRNKPEFRRTLNIYQEAAHRASISMKP